MNWKALFARQRPPMAAVTAMTPEIAPPTTAEEAFSRQGVMRGGTSFESYNPDELQRKKGSGVYEKMLRDAQVWAVYNLVVELLLSRKWRFVERGGKRQERLRAFFVANIEGMEGTFTDLLRKVMTAKQTGVSLVEKVYRVGTWDGQAWWMLRTGKLRPLSTFTFDEDAHGNVLELIQQAGVQRLHLEPARFIRYVNHPEYDPVWGRSDLLSMYTPWWEKNNIAKMWDMYLERLAGGFLAIRKTGSVSPTAETSLREILANPSTAMGILLPENTEISLVHASATDAFERAQIQRNMEIARAGLVPQLLGFSEQGRTGSYAQAEIQSEVFFQYLINEGDRIADVLNESLWAELARWNFGTDEYPRMVFEPFTDAQKKRILDTWAVMLEKGAVKALPQDEAKIRKMLGFDPMEEDAGEV